MERSVWLVYQDRYEGYVIGVASTYEKAQSLMDKYMKDYKRFEPDVDLIQQEDLWIQEVPLDKIIEDDKLLSYSFIG